MNNDGTSIKNISRNNANEFGFSWSPDGDKLAFTSENFGRAQIFIINSDGTGRQNLTGDDMWHGYPDWSPDGNMIAYVTGQPEMQNGQANIKGQIYIMKIGGSDKTDLSHDVYNDWNPVWSPDGKKIAFVSYKDAIPQIFTMNSDGTQRQNLSNNQFEELYQSGSPDGKNSFVSYKDAIPQIFTKNSDGTQRQNLSNNQFEELYPVWLLMAANLPLYHLKNSISQIYMNLTAATGRICLITMLMNIPDMVPLMAANLPLCLILRNVPKFL